MWYNTGAKKRNPFNTRELQRISIDSDEAMAIDGCARLGKAFALPGGASTKQTVFLTTGRRQLAIPLVVRDKTFASIEPALKQMVDQGKVKSKVLWVDDFGAQPSWHGDGQKFMDAIPSLMGVRQDAMHAQNRVSKTLHQYHTKRAAAVERLSKAYRYVSVAEYDRIKTVATTPAGAPGGFKLGHVKKIDKVSVPVVFVRTSKDQRAVFKEGECFTSTRFDLTFGGSAAPNSIFEDVFKGHFDYTSHTCDSIRHNLATTYRGCAGELTSCGQCAICDPASVAAAAAAAAARATAPAAALLLPTPSEIDEFGTGAASRRGVGECAKPRRQGNIDPKGAALTSCDSKKAFALAHSNAHACVFPSDAISRSLPKLNRDGSAKRDLRGLVETVTQQGTQYVESSHSLFERALPCGGLNVDNATNLALDLTSYVNSKSRGFRVFFAKFTLRYARV